MDVTTLTDDELTALHEQTLTEQERRLTLERIPAQIATLAANYRSAGGKDDSAIRGAVDRGLRIASERIANRGKPGATPTV